MTTVKQIFNYISMINNNSFYRDNTRQEMSDDIHNEVVKSLAETTLAYKIATSGAASFSEKQLWVMSFELLKNEQFATKVGQFYAEIVADETRKSNNKANNKAIRAKQSAERQEKLAKLRVELGYN